MRGVSTPAVIGHEMSGRSAAVGAGRDGLGARRPRSRSCRSTGAAPAPPAGPATSTSASTWSSSASTRRVRCSSRWTVPARLLVRLPQDLAAAPRARSSSPRRSPCMTYAARGVRRVEQVARGRRRAGRHADRLGRARATGAEVLVVEPDALPARGRARTRARRPSTPRPTTWPASSRRGPPARARTSPSRSPARPGRRGPPRSTCWRVRGRLVPRRHPPPAARGQPAPLLLARARPSSARGSTSAPTSSGRSSWSPTARSRPRRSSPQVEPLDRAPQAVRGAGGRRRRDEGPGRLPADGAADDHDRRERRSTSPAELAVVTGARRGIGLAMAEALAAAGADIIGVSADLEAVAAARRESGSRPAGRTLRGDAGRLRRPRRRPRR